jgi:hypothetical protein
MPTQQPYAPGSANSLQRGFDHCRIDAVRSQAFQTEKNGAIGTVAAAGQGQRAVQLRGHLSYSFENTLLGQLLDEGAGRVHGAHGV